MQYINTAVNKIKICVYCQSLGDKDHKTKELNSTSSLGLWHSVLTVQLNILPRNYLVAYTLVSVFLRTVRS